MSMDSRGPTALDSAFDRLLEAAAELRQAEREAEEAGKGALASEVLALARAVEAKAEATVVIRRALRS